MLISRRKESRVLLSYNPPKLGYFSKTAEFLALTAQSAQKQKGKRFIGIFIVLVITYNVDTALDNKLYFSKKYKIGRSPK